MIPGNPDRPVIVFLHEGLGCVAMWKHFPARLCKVTGCTGLVYDRIGYGRSAPTDQARSTDYLHQAADRELPNLIDAVIPDREYCLFGHSDGGSIALIHAATKPALLCGVISEAAHVSVEELALCGIRDAVTAFDNGELNGLYKYHGEKTGTVFSDWSDIWLSADFSDWNIENLLPFVDAPVLAIQGVDDQYGTELQVDAIVERCAGSNEKVMIENCAHSPHHEASDTVIAAAARWMANLR